MISITPLQTDNALPWIVEELPESDFGTLQSRVSRVATLDGASTIINSGSTESDRTLVIKTNVTLAQSERLELIRATSPMVNLSSAKGFYYGAIESIAIDKGVLKLTFLVNKKIA